MRIWDIIFGRKESFDPTLQNNVSLAAKKEGLGVIEGETKTSLGWGVVYKGRRYITHSKLPLADSAVVTLNSWQKSFLLCLVLAFGIGLNTDIKLTAIFVIAVISFIYFADFIFSLYILLKSLNLPPEIKFNKDDLNNLSDVDLPTYTVLCPLYREEKVIPHFLNAIETISWPKEKMEVILLLEEDDDKTLQAAKDFGLASYVKLLVVPQSLPKTKPKACNYGLGYSMGKYVVVYDAEDRPDPMQLKKAYLAFKNLPEDVICLQSKLNYYNPNQNLLTKLFTAEYSLWFDLVLPGLQSIATVIPLGGTSNHFKTSALKSLGGWDAFNVTEDCDLGARLFKKGFKTEIIDSTTYEEANSKFKGWIKQRSRWIKGYVQTYLVHMRDPIGFLRVKGIHALIFQLVIGMRMVFILINPILWIVTFSYFAFNSSVGAFIEALYPAPVYYVAVFSFVFGNFLHFYNYMIGLVKRGKWEMVSYVFLIPFYWFSASIAAVVAFYQLITKPHFWEKTEHGLHLTRSEAFTEIKVSLAFEAGILEVFGKVVRNFSSPLAIFWKNIVDLLDLFGPLPEIGERAGLKILILNWRDTKHVWAGGAEVYVQEIVKRWVAAGHNVTLFCGWDGRSQREEKVDGVSVIRRGGFFTVYLFALLYYIFRLKGKFDVLVDCENGIPFFTPFYSDRPKLLLIHHVHQDVFRQHLPIPLSTIASFLESNVMPLLYKNVQKVTISKSSLVDIVQRGWGSEDKVKIVNPGVALSKTGIYKKSSNPSFVYVGRLKSYKNVDVAISAFAELKKKYVDSKLTIAGFGETLPELIRLAKRLGVYESIIFAGRVSEEEKYKLFSESWVALQPSSIEGWGITVIEANACGTPVVASNVKGLRDSVKEGVTGYLVEAGNVSEFAKKMEYLITNHGEREWLGQNCIAWARLFSWENSAWEFMNLMNSVIDKAKSNIPSLEVVTNE